MKEEDVQEEGRPRAEPKEGARPRASFRIPKLRSPAILYIDDSPESREAHQILQDAGVEPLFVTNGPVDPPKKAPLLIHNGGGMHDGINEIRGYLDLLKFWSEQHLPSGRFIFQSVFEDELPHALR